MAQIEVSSELVVKCCNNALSAITKKRDNELEYEINLLMNKRFFKCKTREKAIKALSVKGDIYDLHMSTIDEINLTGGYIYDLANELLKLTNYADKIVLTDDETRILNFNHIIDGVEKC